MITQSYVTLLHQENKLWKLHCFVCHGTVPVSAVANLFSTICIHLLDPDLLCIPSLKLTCSPLKIYGWKLEDYFPFERAYVQGRLLLVLGMVNLKKNTGLLDTYWTRIWIHWIHIWIHITMQQTWCFCSTMLGKMH